MSRFGKSKAKNFGNFDVIKFLMTIIRCYPKRTWIVLFGFLTKMPEAQKNLEKMAVTSTKYC